MNPFRPLSASRFSHTLAPSLAAYAAPSLHHTAILPHFIETPHSFPEYSTKYHLSGTKFGRPFDKLRDRPFSPPARRARCPQIDTTWRDIPRPPCPVSHLKHHRARYAPGSGAFGGKRSEIMPQKTCESAGNNVHLWKGGGRLGHL